MIRTWARLVHRRPPRRRTTARPARCWSCWTARGGPDARSKAARTRRLLHGRWGAGRVAVWPDEAALSLWALPPRDLAVLLFEMLRASGRNGTGRRTTADITQAALMLAVTAPPGPPPAPAEFLGRLDGRRGWAARLRRATLARPARGQRRAAHLPDIALRYRTLLGPARPRLRRPRPPWLMPMRGIASWKAPARNPWPRHRPWP